MLFETYKDRVYSLAVHFTGDEAVAKDIAQDIFLKLFLRIGQFRGEAEFGTWVYRLVANACMDEHRRRRRLVPLTAESGLKHPEENRPQEKRFARRQVCERVQAAVAQLSPKLRMPILLRYLEELSYEEIAAVLGCSSGTVASRLNRGHRELARKLASLRGSVM